MSTLALIALPLNGCLYLGPISLLVNLPPVIELHTAEGTITISGSAYTFFAGAQDPESQELSFIWELSESGALFHATPQADPNYQMEKLELVNDESFDGQLLDCSVSDGEFTDTVRWTIEVL